MDIAAKVRQIIAKHLGVASEKMTPEARIVEELGADSLDTVELLMEIEEAFGISVPETDAQQLTTVGAIIAYIEEKLRGGGTATNVSEPPATET